jgi:hypothetical protein
MGQDTVDTTQGTRSTFVLVIATEYKVVTKCTAVAVELYLYSMHVHMHPLG